MCVCALAATEGMSKTRGLPCCCLLALQDVFPAFFSRVLALRLPESWARLSQHEATSYLLFMINAFQSLEDEMVRAQVSSSSRSTT